MIFVYDLIEELCYKKDVSITKMCRDCNIPRSVLTDYKKGRLKSLSAVGWLLLSFQSARSSRYGSYFVRGDKVSKSPFSAEGPKENHLR